MFSYLVSVKILNWVSFLCAIFVILGEREPEASAVESTAIEW